jgi:hypothetical protein
MSGEARQQAAQAADAANIAISFTNRVIEARSFELPMIAAEEGARTVRGGLDTMSNAIQSGNSANHDIIEDAGELVDIFGRLGPEATPVLEAVQTAILFTGSLSDQIISPTEVVDRVVEGTVEQIASLAGPLAMLGDVANGSRAELVLGEGLTREVERDL